MSLATNLAAAEEAVAYVKGLDIVACNRVADRIKAAGGIDKVIGSGQGGGNPGKAGEDVLAVRDAFGDLLDRDGLTVFTLRAIALAANMRRSGNCMEQAAIAFVYLYDKGVRPIDYTAFGNRQAGYDHVWVTIGLDAGWQRGNLRSWGNEAVWCDPWQGDGVAFAVDDLVKGKVRNLNAIYKCNTAELVEAGLVRSLVHA